MEVFSSSRFWRRNSNEGVTIHRAKDLSDRTETRLKKRILECNVS